MSFCCCCWVLLSDMSLCFCYCGNFPAYLCLCSIYNSCSYICTYVRVLIETPSHTHALTFSWYVVWTRQTYYSYNCSDFILVAPGYQRNIIIHAKTRKKSLAMSNCTYPMFIQWRCSFFWFNGVFSTFFFFWIFAYLLCARKK